MLLLNSYGMHHLVRWDRMRTTVRLPAVPGAADVEHTCPHTGQEAAEL